MKRAIIYAILISLGIFCFTYACSDLEFKKFVSLYCAICFTACGINVINEK